MSASFDALEDDCARSVGDPVSLLPLRGARILITGGTGFVGTWVTQMVAHLNDHHQFGIRISLLSPGAREFAGSAPHLASRGDVRLMEGDARNLSELPADTEWIIHGAGTPDSRTHFSSPVRTMETMVGGTHAVMNAAARLTPLQRILHLSSGLVYGPQRWEDAPLAEKAFSGFDCANPASLYAESKRAAEMVSAAYRTQFGLPILTARLFAFAGPYQLLDRPWAINNFLRDAMRGGPIRVQGNGETVRSYMYGSDLAFWLLRLLIVGKVGAAYNVGSPEGISLKDLAAKIAGHFPRQPGIVLNTLPTAGIPRTQWLPDVTMAERDCDLRLRTSLDRAIARIVAWHTS